MMTVTNSTTSENVAISSEAIEQRETVQEFFGKFSQALRGLKEILN